MRRPILAALLVAAATVACDVHPNIIASWEGRCVGNPTPSGAPMNVPVSWTITDYDDHVLTGFGTVETGGVNGLGDFDGELEGEQNDERIFVDGFIPDGGFRAWAWHGWVGGFGGNEGYDVIEGGCTAYVGNNAYSALSLRLTRVVP